MAPEYLIGGQLTEKADVYAFGVLVIEVAAGRKNSVFSEGSSSILHVVRFILMLLYLSFVRVTDMVILKNEYQLSNAENLDFIFRYGDITKQIRYVSLLILA